MLKYLVYQKTGRLSRQRLFQGFLGLIVIIILLSPLAYWSTGIGQAAPGLPAEVGRLADDTLVSSPKAEALRQLSLLMRLERLLIYPLLLLAFQFSGGATALRRWLMQHVTPGLMALCPGWASRLAYKLPAHWRKRLAGSNLLLTLLFVLALHLAIYLLYLPFNFYRSFIVGQQFGLSSQSATGWLLDWSKSVGINLALNGLLWSGFYSLMRLAPHRWPIPGGALLLGVNLSLTLLAPVLITPLFYTVSPLEEGLMKERLMMVAQRAGLPTNEIYVIDASSKTTAANAYVSGFGNARQIVFYDTLLNNYSPAQVEVVLAHELGHWYYQHVLLSVVGLSAVAWLGLFGLRWLLDKSWRRLGLSGPADVAGLPFIMAVIALVSLLALPIENGFSRYGENQADEFALAVSRQPEAFVTLFEDLAEQNLSIVDPHPLEKLIFYTHPPIVERIDRANRFLP